jgi:hypothetical protein
MSLINIIPLLENYLGGGTKCTEGKAPQMFPLVQKTDEGKLTRFIPLQRHLLLLLRETHLFRGHGYMGMCLVHDYYLCLDRPVKLNAQRFCDRWGICISYFYKGRKELIKQGLLKLSNKLVTICSHLVRCSNIEHPQGNEETEPFAEEEFSTWRKEILHLENENSSNPLPETDCGDSLRSSNIRSIEYNQLIKPSFPHTSYSGREGVERNQILQQSLIQKNSDSEGVQFLERSGSKTYTPSQDTGGGEGEEVSESYLVNNELPNWKPVKLGTKPNPDLEPIEDPASTTNTLEEVADEELTSLNTEPGSWTTTTDPHEGSLPGGENDSQSSVWDLDVVEAFQEAESLRCSSASLKAFQEEVISDIFDEVLDAEVVEDVAIIIQEETDALLVVVEPEVEYSPQVQRAIELYERTGTIPRGHDLTAWAETEMGEYVKVYRKSGRILSTKPNDVVVDFRKFLIEKKTASNPIAWINAMERNPQRWGELADMVQEFKEREFKKSDEGKKLKMEYYKNSGLGVTGRWSLD